MVATSHPEASAAGLAMLRMGGSAVDAAIAAALVLGVVEPHTSGIGGGGFMLVRGGEDEEITSFDGREMAPGSVDPRGFVDPGGYVRRPQLGASLVALPGQLRMFERAHGRFGLLPWRELFQPAIRLARKGVPVSDFLAEDIARNPDLVSMPVVQDLFFRSDGSPRRAGEVIRNHALAETLSVIAEEGADAFHSGVVAFEFADALGGAVVEPVSIAPEDLMRYEARETPVLCHSYRSYIVCVPPPPSGGLTLLQALGMLERFDVGRLEPTGAPAINLLSQATRVAYADRLRWLADPTFVSVPIAGLLERRYLAHRARLISTERNPGLPGPGRPFGLTGRDSSADPERESEAPSTTHVSVVDGERGAVSATFTLGRHFGSGVMVRGVLLNASMAAFSARPVVRGEPVANRIEPYKRPRSSMAPALVFRADGSFAAVAGAPGGVRIPSYMTKTLVGLIDWDLRPQTAVELANHSSRTQRLELEDDPALDTVAAMLGRMGHRVVRQEMKSGTNVIVRRPDGVLAAGVDARRGGAALGN